MVQTVHYGRKPVIEFIRPVAPGLYQANITTYYTGIVSVVLPLLTDTGSSTVQSTQVNLTFTMPASSTPSIKATYASLVQSQTQAGTFAVLSISLRDEWGNKITTGVAPSLFSVNLLPDNARCNTSASTFASPAQNADVLTFTRNVTKACHYRLNVFYFNPTHGQQQVPCLNCYLKVVAASEEFRRFDFLDARDTLVSVMGGQSLYLNSLDWSPKLVLIMRDIFGNLATAQQASDLAFSYTFDISFTSGKTTALAKNATWVQLRGFHFLSFCPENTPFCLQAAWPGAFLRIRQLSKATGVQVGTANIPVVFVTNAGTFYNSDALSSLSANYTVMRVLNQDADAIVGHDLPVIPDRCIGGL